jgi:hypothetical protein
MHLLSAMSQDRWVLLSIPRLRLEKLLAGMLDGEGSAD